MTKYKMIKILNWVSIIVFLLISIQSVKGQTNPSKKFLQKVGQLDSLYSKTLKETRTFYVQLPASYDNRSKEKYPVVFIIDGEVLLPTVNNVQSFYRKVIYDTP